ncbi:MAG: tyrosine--tRNA ligase [Candidatus Woesearchaeota archaeon]
MTPEERLALIKRRTQELVKEEELIEIFKEKKHPKAYIGFAPTGRLHIGYLIPLMKIKDFLDADCEFTFLLADLHAYLDDEKTPWDLLGVRVEYYKAAVTAALKALGADTKRVSFVRGTDFQLKKDYTMHVYQMVGDVTLNRAKRSASEVVRFKEDPKLGGFVYPILQIEDVYALEADIAFGGIDQRGIYMLGREFAEKMNRKKYACVFTPLLPGITGAKMSASDPSSKIDLLDSPEEIVRKLNKANCPAGKLEDNGVVAFIENVIFPLLASQKKPFVINRAEKFGGPLSYNIFEHFKSDFVAQKVHPLDVKTALGTVLVDLLGPVRESFAQNEKLLKDAYPDE